MNKKWILGIGYFYVLLPTILFFLGWVKTWIAVPACLLLIWFWKKAIEEDTDLYLPVWDRKNIMRGIIIIMMIAVWVYFSGIGNLVWQNSDHKARNALYEMLVANQWPVIKSVVCKEGVQIRGLIYYIGYWLPAAVIGKMFGLTAGYLFQYLWAVIGILLCTVFLNSFMKKWAIWPAALFMIFSGLDALGCILSGNAGKVLSFAHLEGWSGLQFSSFTTQLYWVFNQAVYAWILFALIMMQKNNKHIIWIWILGLITCTFPFVGMMPFVVYVILRNRKANLSDKKSRIQNELFSVENILGGGMGVVCLLYLAGNLSAQNSALPVAAASSIQDTEDMIYRLIRYALFIFVEIGVYYIYIYRNYKKNRLFYISLAILLLCPFVRVGSSSDFCMRASIPSLMVLYYMVAQSLRKDLTQRNIRCIFIIALLAVGSINTVHEIGRSVYNTIQRYHCCREIVNPTASEDKVLQANNFSGEIEDVFFFNYLAR